MKKNEKQKKVLGGDRLRQHILEDDTFGKYSRIVKSIKKRQDIEALTEEMMRLHSGRIARALQGTNPGPQKLTDANLQDSSYRSRMAEIQVKIMLDYDRLSIAVSAIRKHLAREYADSMPDLKTKGERLEFFDAHIESGIMLMARLKSLSTRLDILIKDIDQTGFTLKRCGDILELVYGKNAKTV